MTPNKQKQIEELMLTFAGQLTQSWVDTISCFIGTGEFDQVQLKNRMLLQVRDSDLARVDAIERQLGISPTTAEIRKWFKQEKRGQDYEDWIRNRS